MKQRKTLSRKHLGSSLRASLSDTGIRRMQQAPLYGISPKHPGKLIQRLPDGSEIVGTFKNGVFVSSNG
ncbi:MAG TPA: hypothetical protein VEZ11_01080 [Thermoanaerobaculia bacterium]|jgi:hypothetical protein|nr:hypothetical protein [Thermoanaerobaculia bacterium]